MDTTTNRQIQSDTTTRIEPTDPNKLLKVKDEEVAFV